MTDFSETTCAPTPVGQPIALRLQTALAATPKDRIALSTPDGQITWGEMADRIDGALAMIQQCGLQTGDRAVIGLGDEIANCCLFLACLAAGVTAVMTDRHATGDDMERVVAAASPRAVWIGPHYADSPSLNASIAPPPPLRVTSANTQWPAPPAPETIAAVVFTSGTTWRPKGVQISHRALSAQMDAFAQVYGFNSQSRLLNLLPLHHVDGLFRGLVAAAVSGAELHRSSAFTIQGLSALAATLRDARITHFIAVPTILSLILRVMGPDDKTFVGPDLRHVISSADFLDGSLWRRAEAFFGVPVLNSWGQSETVCDALYAVPGQSGRRIGTIGRPVGCEARVADSWARPYPTEPWASCKFVARSSCPVIWTSRRRPPP